MFNTLFISYNRQYRSRPQWVVEEYLYLLYDALVRQGARHATATAQRICPCTFDLTYDLPVPYAAQRYLACYCVR